MRSLLIGLFLWVCFNPVTQAADLREVNSRSASNHTGSSVLDDIDQHMPASHDYVDRRDYIGWAHETTHGLHSLLRDGQSRANAVYVMNNQYILLPEPNTTIKVIAQQIPNQYRGGEYKFYLTGWPAQSWNNQPLYIFEEWCAYTNGSIVRSQLGTTSRRDTTEKSLEFTVYCTFMVDYLYRTNQLSTSVLEVYLWQYNRAIQAYQANRPLGVQGESFYYSLTQDSAVTRIHARMIDLQARTPQ